MLSGIGGIFCLALNGSGFWSFVYWSTCIISLLFFGMNVFQMMPALEARFPLMSKVVSVNQIGFKNQFTNIFLLLFSETWICFHLAHSLLDLCIHKFRLFQLKCGKYFIFNLKTFFTVTFNADLGLLVDHFVRSWSVFPLPRIQIRRRCWCHRFKSYRHRSFGWRSAQVLMIQKTSKNYHEIKYICDM